MTIDRIVTEKGSIYRYLPNGKTQRYKKIDDSLQNHQDILVFVPPYDWVKQNSPENVRDKLGRNEKEYIRMIETYIFVQGKKARIVDSSGKKLASNEEVRQTEGQVFLALGTETETDLAIPVSKEAKLEFYAFDTRKFENGTLRESHLGHKVVEIIEK